MKVSVIVPTYNGAHKVPFIIEALKKQSFKDFELLIVVDGSTDDTLEVLSRMEITFDDFKIINQKNKGRAAVRNKGAEMATGDLLIFFDDDMRPTADCIQQHMLHHQMHPNSIMGGAQIDDLQKAVTPFQKYKCYLSNSWVKHLVGKKTPLTLSELHLTAANFSISKQLFIQLGGFDERLKDNEDFDLALRAYKEGIPVFYNHDAFAWHDDFPSCKTFIKRQLEYKSYHQFVFVNKKEEYGDISRFSNQQKITSIKKIFYSFWKAKQFPSLVDRKVFSFLPLKVQFKIYNWIVFAQTL